MQFFKLFTLINIEWKINFGCHIMFLCIISRLTLGVTQAGIRMVSKQNPRWQSYIRDISWIISKYACIADEFDYRVSASLNIWILDHFTFVILMIAFNN